MACVLHLIVKKKWGSFRVHDYHVDTTIIVKISSSETASDDWSADIWPTSGGYVCESRACLIMQ